ncbi:MAG: cation-transporting P-type ATPase, partial [Gammaproteobacteria bacterium]
MNVSLNWPAIGRHVTIFVHSVSEYGAVLVSMAVAVVVVLLFRLFAFKKQAGDTSLPADTSLGSGTMTWHAMEASAVLKALDSNADRGLDSGDVHSRLERYGSNRLPERKPPSALLRFIGQFHNLLIYVLLATAGITALLNHWTDTLVILGVVLVNAAIGYVQEGKAEDALRAIRKMLTSHAIVLRGGKKATIAASDLVPGDIV